MTRTFRFESNSQQALAAQRWLAEREAQASRPGDLLPIDAQASISGEISVHSTGEPPKVPETDALPARGNAGETVTVDVCAPANRHGVYSYRWDGTANGGRWEAIRSSSTRASDIVCNDTTTAVHANH